jgi:Cytochrome c554 and c-prime
MLLAILPMIVCGQCHAEIVTRYSTTPMANSSGILKPAGEPTGGFLHAISGVRYDIVKSGSRLELQWNRHRRPLDFFIGSRRMGRSYGFAADGYLYQAPVGYYANRRLWDMAPGYENDRHPDFNRPITEECLFCHATGARATPKTLNRFADLSALQGISCERCHGDASGHLAHPQAGNILNPKKLPFAERDSVCEQCHLSGEARIAQPGRQITDFRPGQRLSTYLAVFVAEGRPAGIRVTSHAEALAASRCRQASGQKLWCGACHDPHGRPAGYREKCLGCHAPRDCTALRNVSNRGEADCIACHMPKARAFDGGHTVFTDHSILRSPPDYSSRKVEPVSLASYFPPDVAASTAGRNLGIAWAQVAENYGDPRLFDKAWPLLRAAAEGQPLDPALYAKVAEALESASKTTEAEKAYRLSLEQDPGQVEVLLRLAALLERSGKRTEAAALRKRASAIMPPVRQSGE